MIDEPQAPRFSGRTAWARNMQTPLRDFLRTETGGAAVLLAAAVAASSGSTSTRRRTTRSGRRRCRSRSAGRASALDLRDWVNSGLMTFFFFVVGLEARREFDLGELRERRRFALPLLAGLGGMLVAGRDLPRLQRRPALRARLGDRDVDRHRLRARHARARRAAVPRPAARVHAHGGRRRRHRRAGRDRRPSTRSTIARRAAARGGRRSSASSSSLRSASDPRTASSTSLLGAAAWVALLKSGVEPVVVGLAMGLLAVRLPGRRASTSSGRPSCSASSASSRRPSSRARPAPSSAPRSSPNERLQQLFHPWTSYVIVPLFALANAGIAIDGGFLAQRFTLADHARHPVRLRRRQAGRDRSAARGW